MYWYYYRAIPLHEVPMPRLIPFVQVTCLEIPVDTMNKKKYDVLYKEDPLLPSAPHGNVAVITPDTDV